MGDLRQYISARPDFYPPPAPDLLSGHRGLGQPHPYDLLVFRSDSTTSVTTPPQITNIGGAHASSGGCFGGFESGLNCGGGGDGGAGRWPRQETLTLLEIRSRLDPKFKEANQKGPLWDEVSRIMSEEHGYQRSGKKCREKFENLYKYYKKTKEGKAGRQDGKHYRFFRQLEALYGETNNNNSSSASVSEAHHLHHHHHTAGTPTNYPYNNNINNTETLIQCPKFSDNTSLSLSNYSEAEEPKSKKRSGKTCWKLKIKDFIDTQMKKMMDIQEAWMEKMVATMEHKERERLVREEEWRKQDAERIEREHKFWAGERAWIEARDAALMEALHKLTGKELMTVGDVRENEGEIWAEENEMARLAQLKAATKFEGLSENVLWDEIANKMGCLGHERSGKDKWDSSSVSNYLIKSCSKKRKENSKSCAYYDHHHSNHGGGVYCGNGDHQQGVEPVMRLNDQYHSSPNNNNNNNNNNGLSESCFRYYMGDATYGRIME
ncbi:trihelix transcription factor ptl [Phtheirospermum japonicum]|uniref:Trihelix transcription factor ptl n=1 Tax=Phtheirospermum japonicum TaxID=374723 RepID=A0A830C9Z4_9LAMI|nr:trihelix transcription factor ptl [Phtheirospermum japonicum]